MLAASVAVVLACTMTLLVKAFLARSGIKISNLECRIAGSFSVKMLDSVVSGMAASKEEVKVQEHELWMYAMAQFLQATSAMQSTPYHAKNSASLHAPEFLMLQATCLQVASCNPSCSLKVLVVRWKLFVCSTWWLNSSHKVLMFANYARWNALDTSSWRSRIVGKT